MTDQAAAQDERESSARRRPLAVRTRAWAWTALGYGFFAVGLVGIALPVLPTTIFWIAAAACFAKGCPAMARRIYAWPGVGPAVEAFLSHGVIARRGKVGAIVGMTFGGLLVALTPLAPAARLITLAVIALAALYVATRPESLPQALPAERN
ncbi:MAG TPA: YbaN family protein [Kiloniellaceae bacterium]